MGETDTTEATEPAESERLDRVEDKLDKLADAVNRLLPGSHKEAEHRTEERLDRSSSIEEQVAAELEKRDRLAREQADADAAKAERETTAQRLARLEERPPAPPRSRRTTLLGWGDGRDAR